MANNMHIVYQFQGMKLQLAKTNSDSSQNGSWDKLLQIFNMESLTEKHLVLHNFVAGYAYKTPTLLGKILHQLIEPLSHGP